MSHRTRRRLVNWGLNLLTALLVVIMVAPIVWMVFSSLQTNSDLILGRMSRHLRWENYSTMWNQLDMAHYFQNSIIIVGTSTVLATAFACTAGYALARFRFRGADSFSLLVMLTQIIPGVMFLLPIYMSFVWLGTHLGFQFIDTYRGMILVYTAFFTPISIYLMRAFFAAIPPELEEAAQVDGCSRFGAFWRVVLPNAAPGILATAVYAFLFAWDELLFAQTLTDDHAATIPVGMRLFIGQVTTRYDLLMAAGVATTIPVALAFFATQRWLVRGLTAGAVKG
jgi:multiple sugar transport system permease protein